MFFPSIKIPWQVWACSGVVLVLGLCGWKLYDLGQDHKQAEWAASIERGKAAVEELKKKQTIVTTRVETKYVDRIKVIHEKGKDIVKRVEVFVPVGSCDLPGGFRLLHDSAAANTVPDSSEIANALPVPAQTVASTVAENYTTCNQWREQLIGLQEWVTEIGKLPHTLDNSSK